MAEENYWQDNNVQVQDQESVVGGRPAKKHSGLGIASFVLSVIAVLTMFVLVVMAAVMAARTGEEVNKESPEAAVLGVIGCGIIAAALLYLVGIGLAIGGLCQRNRHKVFPVLGLVLNIVFLLGIAGLMVIGILAA